jgi:hypothetical protein
MKNDDKIVACQTPARVARDRRRSRRLATACIFLMLSVSSRAWSIVKMFKEKALTSYKEPDLSKNPAGHSIKKTYREAAF